MRVLIGVTGGIAAYKAADLTSMFVGAGHDVRVVMTESATKFVGTTTFEALSNHVVMSDVFGSEENDENSAIQHIAWAKWPELVIVAPLTAASLGRFANGIASDALSTLLLALPSGTPTLLCPAMNSAMWLHPAVQRNTQIIASFDDVKMMQPVEKRLACGDVGVGGLPAPSDIMAAALKLAARKPERQG